MEWERAKTYILIAFIALNIGLGGMRFIEHRRHTITADQVNNIITVLSRNSIHMYTSLIQRFPPMQPLEITGFYYSSDELIQIFFSGYEGTVNISSEWEGHQMFETEQARLEIINGFIFFENKLIQPGRGGAIVTGLAAPAPQAQSGTPREIADRFINEHFSGFEFDFSFSSYLGYGQYGTRLVYRQVFRRQAIHTNFVEFLVTEEGIAQIEAQFGRVEGHGGTYRNIFSADEVLLTFMQTIRHIAIDNPIFVIRMDMVYLKEYASDQPGSVYQAVPFYRIFIRGQEDFPFLINAYTNTLLN